MQADVGILALFAALALYGAYWDIRYRAIPNAFNALMAISGIAALWLSAGPTAAAYGFAHLAAALAAGMLLYALGMWGGGDAKFYAASAAWFELWDFPRLAVSIALSGLLLLAVWFVWRRVRGSPKVDKRTKVLPYGVAIAIGGIAAWAVQL